MQSQMSRKRAEIFARFRRPYWLLAFVVLIVTLISIPVMGQGVRGTITGQVTDQAGAVIPGATVKLVNRATGQVVRTVKTDANGGYQLVEVDPANYNLLISAQGFADATLQNAKLDPTNHLSLDVTLAAAGVTEQVTVTSSEQLLDRESSTLGTTVENRRVEGLPLDGRNIMDLALLQPGVAPIADPFGGSSGSTFRVNGARATGNNFTLNGANNNEIAFASDFDNEPRPDAVQEFRLLTANYDAEYGRNTGSVINVVVKGGGSGYHGDARLFYRPTSLSAAQFFDNLNGLPKRIFERKEFGGNIGGPIPLPVIDRGVRKTYFFFDYEGRRQLIGVTNELSLLPTAAEKAGDWSALLKPNNEFSATPIQLVNPINGQNFPNNVISPGLISPIARYYLNFLPNPDASGRAGVQGNEPTNNDYVTARLDQTITDKQQASFIANYFQGSSVSPFAFGGINGGANTPGFGSVDLRNTYSYIATHTYSITPTLVNSLLLSYTRNNFPAVSPINHTTPQQIGFTANFVADPQFAGPPFIQLLDSGLTFGNTIQGPQARISQNYQIQDSVSWVKGNHRFKFGADGTKYFQPQTFLFVNQGILTYSAQQGTPTTGLDYADLMMGLGPIAQQYGANGQRDSRQLSYAFFGQDGWKLKDNLTLNIGLRWEYVGPITDKLNQVAYYRPGEVSQRVANGQLRVPGGQLITATGIPVNGLVYPGDPDNILGGTVPRAGYHATLGQLAPRIGIAYSPKASSGWRHFLVGDSATVIRAGWGIFYDGASVADTQLQQLSAPGYNGTNSFFFPAGGTLANPFAPSPIPNSGLPTIPNPFLANTFDVSAPLFQFSQPVDPHLKIPYTYQYNFTVERTIHKDYLVSVGYIGTRGVHLYAVEQINPALGTFIPFSSAIAPIPGGGSFPVPDQNNANSRRMNPDIQLGLGELVTAGNSWYNSLQAQVQKRLSHGMLFQVAYTYSKSISDSDDSRGQLDLLNRASGKGVSRDDIPHRLVGSWIYDLPFFAHSSGLLGRLLGGYSFGGIATFSSGSPFTVLNPFDTDGTGGAILSFADLGAPFTLMDPRKNDTRAFNANAFQIFGDPMKGFNLAKDFRRGTEGPNQFRANNGLNNWNLIVSKTTRLWNEASVLELRLELFNAFNHTQFAITGPNGTGLDLNLNDPNFGKYTATQQSRVVQLGARVRF
jgi:hypothetical protein